MSMLVPVLVDELRGGWVPVTTWQSGG